MSSRPFASEGFGVELRDLDNRGPCVSPRDVSAIRIMHFSIPDCLIETGAVDEEGSGFRKDLLEFRVAEEFSGGRTQFSVYEFLTSLQVNRAGS